MINTPDARVLYIEDDAEMRILFKASVELHGYAVELAENGTDGLALCATNVFDVVAIDYLLPDMTGIDVARKLLADDPLRPLFMVTGKGDEKIAVEAMSLGVSDYAIKRDVEVYTDRIPGIIRNLLKIADQNRKLAEAERALKERSARLESIFETVVDGIVVINSDGMISELNRAAEHIFGYPRDEVLGRNLNMLMPESFNDEYDISLQTHQGANETSFVGVGREVLGKRKNGEAFPMDLAISEANWETKHYVGIVRDITPRKKVEAELRESEERAKAVLNTSSQLMGLLKPDGTLIEANAAALSIIDARKEDLAGQAFWDCPWWDHDPEIRAQVKQAVNRAGQGEVVHFHTTHLAQDGNEQQIDFRITPITNTEGEVILLVPEGYNVTALKKAQSELERANEKLQRLASIDGLTQVPNRRHFDETLDKECNRLLREGSSISLILSDIDYFKKYNDTYGHQGGDDCLCQVAAAMASALHRPADMLARYGGEEFAIILPNTDEQGARQLAESVREAVLGIGVEHESSEVNDIVTLSLGISSMVPDKNTQPELLISLADQALYKAKENGRNRVELAQSAT